MDIKIKNSKNGKNSFAITFVGCPAGYILALKHALERYESLLAKDILGFLDAAITGNPELQKRLN